MTTSFERSPTVSRSLPISAHRRLTAAFVSVSLVWSVLVLGLATRRCPVRPARPGRRPSHHHRRPARRAARPRDLLRRHQRTLGCDPGGPAAHDHQGPHEAELLRRLRRAPAHRSRPRAPRLPRRLLLRHEHPGQQPVRVVLRRRGVEPRAHLAAEPRQLRHVRGDRDRPAPHAPGVRHHQLLARQPRLRRHRGGLGARLHRLHPRLRLVRGTRRHQGRPGPRPALHGGALRGRQRRAQPQDERPHLQRVRNAQHGQAVHPDRLVAGRPAGRPRAGPQRPDRRHLPAQPQPVRRPPRVGHVGLRRRRGPGPRLRQHVGLRLRPGRQRPRQHGPHHLAAHGHDHRGQPRRGDPARRPTPTGTR